MNSTSFLGQMKLRDVYGFCKVKTFCAGPHEFLNILDLYECREVRGWTLSMHNFQTWASYEYVSVADP